ncbi:MAG: hypothetical protein AAF921_01710 [Cyanobacteria bacterium P01_D01_bin.44]
MTSETTGVGGESPEGNAHNDLTQIKGIGPVRQEILQEDLDISTLEALASASIEEIESMLRRENQSVSQQEIIGWIEQAQAIIAGETEATETEAVETEAVETEAAETEFAEAEAAETEAVETEAVETEAVEAEAAEAEIAETAPEQTVQPVDAKPTNAPVDASTAAEWSTSGLFTVEVQTRRIQNQVERQIIVRHVETDRTQQWSNVEELAWSRWILAQTPAPLTPSPVLTDVPSESPITAEINAIRLFQPPKNGNPIGIELTQPHIPSLIRSGEPFTLEITFELVGSALTETPQSPKSYLLQSFTKRLTPPHSLELLSEAQPLPLVDNQTLYTSSLPAASLTSGLYRLQVLITFQGAFALSTFVEVPLLQVV